MKRGFKRRFKPLDVLTAGDIDVIDGGVHPLLSTIETYAARARYSTKVNYFSQSNENDRFNIEIVKVVGARGLFGIGSASPLCWSDDAISAEMRVVKAGIPLISCGGSVWGASAPATIAGELKNHELSASLTPGQEEDIQKIMEEAR